MKANEILGCKLIRQSLGLSIDAFAKFIGKSRQTVSRWENNKVSISEENLMLLSKLFNSPPEYFNAVVRVEDVDDFIERFKANYSIPNTSKRVRVTYGGIPCEIVNGTKFDMMENSIISINRSMEDLRKEYIKVKLISSLMETCNNCITSVNSTEYSSVINSFRRLIELTSKDNDSIAELSEKLSELITSLSN